MKTFFLYLKKVDYLECSAALGGEMTMVDSIMGCLTPSSAGQNRAKRISLTPNVVMNKLQPLLGICKMSGLVVAYIDTYRKFQVG